VVLLEFRDTLFRTHSIDRNPIFFGNSHQNRFDAPDDSYKVLYSGRDAYCAFVESFAWAAGTRVITTAELKARSLAELKPARSLRLIDLTQSGALFGLVLMPAYSPATTLSLNYGPRRCTTIRPARTDCFIRVVSIRCGTE
jgi:hypothetical protein